MFREFERIFTFSLTVEEILSRFVVAVVCGLLISVFYRWSYRGTSYSASYVISLVALSMITASVIMVIGNNLARAFGLVGAMSIIRFRSAIKDTKDIVFIFFSLAMGMAAGVGLTYLAVPVRREYLLQFAYAARDEQEPAYQAIIERHCRRYKLVNVKSLGEDGELLELSFYVHLRSTDDTAPLMRDIGRLEGISYANLYFDEVQV